MKFYEPNITMPTPETEPAVVVPDDKRTCNTCRWMKYYDLKFCDHPMAKAWEPVNGFYSDICVVARERGPCGVVGKLYEPRPPKAMKTWEWVAVGVAFLLGSVISWGWLHGAF